MAVRTQSCSGFNYLCLTFGLGWLAQVWAETGGTGYISKNFGCGRSRGSRNPRAVSPYSLRFCRWLSPRRRALAR